MNFKGIEENTLCANHLLKAIKSKQLIKYTKIQEQNNLILERKSLINKEDSIQRSFTLNKNEFKRRLFAYSFFKTQENNAQESHKKKAPTEKKSSYQDFEFLCKCRIVLSIYFYRSLLIKHKKIETHKMRAKYSKLLAKKNRMRRLRSRCKKRRIQEHYRFFSMKKHSGNKVRTMESRSVIP